MLTSEWKVPCVRAVLLASLVTCGAGAATAQQAPAQLPAAAAPDDEEAFDEKLREFGYWAGAAYGCVDAGKQVEVERKVLDTFNGIARLFGTDRAFFYAAAFGNGTTHKVEPGKCPELLEKFQKATAVRGGRQ